MFKTIRLKYILEKLSVFFIKNKEIILNFGNKKNNEKLGL